MGAHGIMVFNSRFRLKAKEFAVFVNDSGIAKLTEWGSKISNSICMGSLVYFGW